MSVKLTKAEEAEYEKLCVWRSQMAGAIVRGGGTLDDVRKLITLTTRPYFRTLEARQRASVARQRKAARAAPPYTLEAYDAAVAKLGITRQKQLAAALGVNEKTLRKYRRP